MKEIIDSLLANPKETIRDFFGALCLFGSIMALYFVMALLA